MGVALSLLNHLRGQERGNGKLLFSPFDQESKIDSCRGDNSRMASEHGRARSRDELGGERTGASPVAALSAGELVES